MQSIHSKPVYRQIEMELARRILEGDYVPGDRLPGRSALMREYGAAYGTLDRALRSLTERGILNVVNGRGTYIKRIPLESDLESFPKSHADSRDNAVSIFNPYEKGVGSGKVLHQRATIGVIGSTDLAVRGRNWTPVIVHHLERMITHSNGAMHFYNRYLHDEASWITDHSLAERIVRDKVEALVFNSIHYPPEVTERLLQHLVKTDIPVSCISWTPLSLHFPHCYFANVDSGFVAMEHLIRAGYDRVLFGGAFKQTWEKDRLEGARRAIRQYALPDDMLEVVEYPINWTRNGGEVREGGRSFCREHVLDRGRQYSRANQAFAVLAMNDEMAMGILDVLAANELRAGQDIGLLGFDDDDYSQARGLSTVRPPLQELARVAAEMVVDQLNGASSPLRVCCAPEAVARATTFRR